MSKQVVTIGYLKTFVDGILTVSTDKEDSYCPTYSELTGGDLVTNYKADTNPTKTTNGIKVNGCTVTTTSTAYADNQLVIRQDLQLLYQALQSVTVSATNTTISCCGGSSTLSTTAYFKLLTKKEDETTTADTATSASVTGTYSDEKSFTTINGSTITFTKNSVDTTTCTSAAARSAVVTGSYKYSGVTKENTVTITQSKNTIDSTWTNTSTSTNSISVSPSSMSFDSGGGTKNYSVTRYYTQYQAKYDSCNVAVCYNSYDTSSTVTPSDASCTGDFTCTKSSVTIETNTGSERSGTLTVSYDGYTDTCSLSQGASQAGTSYGDPYEYTYGFSVSISNWNDLSCDGGTTKAKATYTTYWKYDWFEKNDAGEITNSGTSSDSSSSNVTNSTTWSTDRGTIGTDGTLTFPATTAEGTTKTTVTGVYGDYSDSDYMTQVDCAPSTPDPDPDTGTTGNTCMNVKYTVESGINCTVYFKTTNGTQQATHTVSQTGDQELCNIADDTVIVVTCSDTGVTLGGDTTFTAQTGSDIYISLNKASTPDPDPDPDTGGTFDSYCVFEIKKDGDTSYSSSVTLDYAASSSSYENLTVNSRYYTAETSYDSIGYTLTSDKTWVTVDNSTKKWSIENNTTYESRSATITLTQTGGTCSKNCYIYINQAGKSNDYVFTEITPSDNLSVSYGANGSSIHITSTKNGANFSSMTVSESCDWLTTKTQSLSGSYYYIPFDVTENTSSSSRSCDVTVTQGESGKKVTVTITQEGKPDNYVFTDKTPSDNINRDKTNVGSSLIVTSTKNGNMFSSITVSESCDWVTFKDTFTSGGDYVLPFNVTENTGTTERSCTVTATQGTSNKQLTWTIKQSAEKEKPLVSTIYVLNNCPGTVNIEYSKPNGGKEYTSITASSSDVFNLPLSGQTDVQVSIPRDNYETSSSNFVYVEFRDSNGNTLPVNPSGNAMEEGGGAKGLPNLMGGGGESSICTTTSKYQACATILFEAKN